MKKLRLCLFVFTITICMVFLTGCEDEEKTSKKEDTKTEQVEEKKITYKKTLICIYDSWNDTIYVDKDTKVMYWWHEGTKKGGLTAMYNADGTPKLYDGDLSKYE